MARKNRNFLLAFVAIGLLIALALAGRTMSSPASAAPGNVTIATDVDLATTNGNDGVNGPVWVSDLDGYFSYFDGTDLRFRKTTNGGASWSASTQINVAAMFNGHYSVWYDRWTPGDSGNIIHFAYEGGLGIRYRQLDILGDVLGGETIVTNPGTNQALDVQITKARNGDLHATWDSNSATLLRGHRRSIDGGTTWVDRANPVPSIGDHIRPLPASNTGDDADIWFLYWERLSDELSIKEYDDSANTLTETLIATGFDAGVTPAAAAPGPRLSVTQTGTQSWLAGRTSLLRL